jgi:ferric-dicitrate binding protein FerR (iron transport regulator)
VAAGIALLLAGGAFYFLSRGSRPVAPVILVEVGDLLPGSKRAVLTLADGTALPLDTTRTGEIAREGTVTAVNRGRVLAYEKEPGNEAGARDDGRRHLLTTPRGAYYEMTLPDDSRAWLNAASSIRYPLAFAGDERRVEVTGEVYFEIEPRVNAATGRRVPFIVVAGDRAEVEVLGTRFNVNAYEDEGEIKATLLEGSVRFLARGTGDAVLVKPGEQARLDAGGRVHLAPVNTREVMAWKEGKFMFDTADIHAITRQISRWYDVEVELRGDITCHFGGTISRDVNISRVFHVLEQTGGVRFSMENNKVIVMPGTAL